MLLVISCVYAACTSIKIHREWRELTPGQQNGYLTASKCLKSQKSILTAVKSPSLWDDLVWLHLQAPKLSAHRAASFLPWHRLLLAVHDELMAKYCGYSGPYPYWDWSKDTSSPEASKIWLSFGGNGVGVSKCINTGAFKDLRIYFSDLSSNGSLIIRNACLSRTWDLKSLMSPTFNSQQLAFSINNCRTYDCFRKYIENIPHNQVHVMIGGVMTTMGSSNDPIFYLHHRNVDRLWNIWQKRWPDVAFTYGGIAVPGTAIPAKTTDVLKMFGFIPNYNVGNVLNSRGGGAGGRMCFDYSNSVIGSTGSLKKRNLNNAFFNSSFIIKPDDRQNLEKMRQHEPIPTDYLLSKNYTLSEIADIRKEEDLANKLSLFLNSATGYVARSSLGHACSARKFGYQSSGSLENEIDSQLNQLISDAFSDFQNNAQKQ
jgi:hypothetical protein